MALRPGAEGHGHGANDHGAPGGKGGWCAAAAHVDKDHGTGSSARDPVAGADWGPAPQFGSATGSGPQRDGRSRSRPGAGPPAARSERTRGLPLGRARLADEGQAAAWRAAGAAAASLQTH